MRATDKKIGVPRAGLVTITLAQRHSRHVPMLARPGGGGGPNPMKRYNIFVILWAIYNSKRTKTPEDIEQINITERDVGHLVSKNLIDCPS